MPKCSELLASHRGGLRSEGYLYPYSIEANLDSRNSFGVSHIQYRYTLTSHLYAIPVSPHSLVKRTTNHMAYNDLCLINVVIFGNNVSFGRE